MTPNALARLASANDATAPLERTTASILADFVSGLAAAESVSEGFRSLSQAVESLGFGAIAYTAIPVTLGAAGSPTPVFLASSGFSGAFLRHYDEAGLARHDFTIERVRAGCLEVMDWAEERAGSRLTAEQSALVDTARFDYGIRNAVTIPTLSDGHVLAGASITCDEGMLAFRTLKRERLETLRIVVKLFHDRVFSASEFRRPFYSPFLGQLSCDECKVIRLIVAGHRLKSSLDLCDISPSRAGNILSSLYRKLGISNASELAYLVGLHQIDRLL